MIYIQSPPHFGYCRNLDVCFERETSLLEFPIPIQRQRPFFPSVILRFAERSQELQLAWKRQQQPFQKATFSSAIISVTIVTKQRLFHNIHLDGSYRGFPCNRIAERTRTCQFIILFNNSLALSTEKKRLLMYDSLAITLLMSGFSANVIIASA